MSEEAFQGSGDISECRCDDARLPRETSMRCFSIVFLLVLGAGDTAGAGEAPPAGASPDELLQYIGKDDYLAQNALMENVSSALGFFEPGVVIGQLAKSGAKFSDVVVAFRRHYGLSKSAAAPLARALVRWHAHGGSFDTAPLELIVEELAAAIRASGGALVPVVSAMKLAEHGGSAADVQRVVRMLEPIVADLPRVSRSIARAAPVAGPFEVWLLALEQDPSLLKTLVFASPSWGIAALYPSYVKALSTTKLSVAERAAVASASLDVLLSEGLAFEAVAFFRALPAPEREALLARPPPRLNADGSLELDGGGPYVSLALGAALYLTGDTATAESIHHRGSSSVYRNEFLLLDAALHPERDAFEVLATAGKKGGLWGQVELRLASTYPAFQMRALHNLTRPSHLQLEDDVDHPPRRVTEATASFARRQAQQREAWMAQLEALSDPPSVPKVRDRVTAGIGRLLETPVLEPCSVIEMAPGPEWTLIRPNVPEGFLLVRASLHEQQAVAVLSTLRDGGGYWVIRSQDAGKVWSTPAYLGLRPDAPYLLGREGALRLTNGAVELVAELPAPRRELRSIQMSEGAKRVALSCDLSVVDRDSDRDGLSDVEEHWLLTDPLHADTDLDGLTDDVDPIPHVPAGGESALEGLAVLDAFHRRRPVNRSIVPGVGPAAGPVKLVERRSVTFTVGARAAFHGVSPTTRLIVLSRTEAMQAAARMGDRVHVQRPFVTVNHNRTLVFIEYNDRFAGATYMLRREPNGWRVAVLSSWIY